MIMKFLYFNNCFYFLAPPVIQVKENLVFAPQGIDFQFPLCRVRSNPPADVTWKRVFWDLPKSRSHFNGSSLKISNVQFDDEGFYICQAENFLGKWLYLNEYLWLKISSH